MTDQAHSVLPDIPIGIDATGQRHQEREPERGGVGRGGAHRVTSLRPAAAPNFTSARPPTRLAAR